MSFLILNYRARYYVKKVIMICRLNINSIDMDIIVDAEERGYECVETHYFSIYELMRGYE